MKRKQTDETQIETETERRRDRQTVRRTEREGGWGGGETHRGTERERSPIKPPLRQLESLTKTTKTT